MASFPELEPAIRSYDFGAFPLTIEPSLAAGTVRFRHAIVASDYQLTLGYQYLTDAEAILIREHFAEQGGGNISFQLPTIVWKGQGSASNIVPFGMRWRYASPPEEEHFSGGYINLQVSLVSDGVIDSSLGTILISISGGGAGGGAGGAALTVTASLTAGTATGA